MITKKYNLINNLGGWCVFLIALVTYWLTLEPTASYWDCGEFIIQADKLEVGHPPGNPIFMLTARFFSNFAPDQATVSVMVNAMSGLLSALTILLLFWTISHLVRRLVLQNSADKGTGPSGELSLTQYIIIMGSAAVGSLAYCWSDTFWFSAVEGEVYAFSSFCTALVFWLILKWENRADNPGSDRYLVLIAYLIGVSIAVHLLNLLCIPAIVLVFVYRKYKDMNLVKSLLALLVSFVIIFLVLFGLVPGFIKVAQQFELLFVNGLHMPFNSGALVYGIVTLATFVFSIYSIRRDSRSLLSKVSFLLAVTLSGMLFFSSHAWIGWVLTALLAVFLFTKYFALLSARVMSVMMWSVAVIFFGYSSYALILIRSSADTPMNQNSPDNVFDLASYLNREQYGEYPLLYGETLYCSPQRILGGYSSESLGTWPDGTEATLLRPEYTGTVVSGGEPLYAKGVEGGVPHSEYNLLSDAEKKRNAELAARGGDYYVVKDHKPEAKMNPELNMVFPRLYSRQHARQYANWVRLDTVPDQLVAISAIDSQTGEKVPELNVYAQPEVNEMMQSVHYPQKYAFKPSFAQNLAYFFNNQLNHMYLRYFMWNFAGRQNDINNQQGELDAGNWISGIPFIDNPRLGDQSLLPYSDGEGNKGHNVFYMLPLIMGIIGLGWQAFTSKRGIEQFWVIFFLFFMTGIAIVLYLNQTPTQPRERDYAFAGSFYAFAIWVGMGVAGLWALVCELMKPKAKAIPGKASKSENPAMDSDFNDAEGFADSKKSLYAAIFACVIGLIVPLQMVSQTWDDHDRSGRYTTRDFGMNYLDSVDENGIIFTNGDNDTFPLWYAQEVEGHRTDVKVVNLSYLTTDWYANQVKHPSYNAGGIETLAKPENYGYERMNFSYFSAEADSTPVNIFTALRQVYDPKSSDNAWGAPMMDYNNFFIPVDIPAAVKAGRITEDEAEIAETEIRANMADDREASRHGGMTLSQILSLDMLATSVKNGWKNPIYFASTVPSDYYVALQPYMRSTGMAYEVTPVINEENSDYDIAAVNTDKAYRNITEKFRWGGLDKVTDPSQIYLDETVRKMVTTTRSYILGAATALINEAAMAERADTIAGVTEAERAKLTDFKADRYAKALNLLKIVEEKLPESASPYAIQIPQKMAQIYARIGIATDNKEASARAVKLLEDEIMRYAQNVKYYQSLNPWQYATLTQTDLFIETYYMVYLLQDLSDAGGDVEKIIDELTAMGINFDRIVSRLQQ